MVFPLLIVPTAYSEVYIPENEYVGFYDHDDVYTVIAGIKNSENFAVVPTLTIEIVNDGNTFSEQYHFSSIMPHEMLPMKVKLPQITSDSPILQKPIITYQKSDEKFSGGYIIYDDSLIINDFDSSLTGKIRNGGDLIFENFRVYALIKDKDHNILDVAASQKFNSMHPGEILDFKLLANPLIAERVHYYSCFAFGDDAIQLVPGKRNGESYPIRYESIGWFAYPEFTKDGSAVSLVTMNNWPVSGFANIELQSHSIHEKFQVYLDGSPVEFIQSRDEMGNWHVAFDLPGYFQGKTNIVGIQDRDGTVGDISTFDIVVEDDGTLTVVKNDSNTFNEFDNSIFILIIIPAAIVLVIISVYRKKKSLVKN
jgi:hypothetical protein